MEHDRSDSVRAAGLPAAEAAWPELPLEGWSDTYATLHRWTQIVGKVRTARTPWINHSWHVTLYPTPRGLTTTAMPHGDRTFQIDFDFIDHRLAVTVSDGSRRDLELRRESVADFYDRLRATLSELGVPVEIHGRPNEMEDDTPFAEDRVHAAYDPEYARRLGTLLSSSARVFTEFRARFLGKASPVHFFWGSFDLAVSRFSGRPAPLHPGGIPHLPDWVAQEAYSHEVASAGFWPGGGPHPFPLFYAYVYPEPPGYAERQVAPRGAFYSAELREFVLPYEVVRTAPDPDAALLAFLEDTYRAAAELADWDRSLERNVPPGP
jgi:hypothetical protein